MLILQALSYIQIYVKLENSDNGIHDIGFIGYNYCWTMYPNFQLKITSSFKALFNKALCSFIT